MKRPPSVLTQWHVRGARELAASKTQHVASSSSSSSAAKDGHRMRPPTTMREREGGREEGGTCAAQHKKEARERGRKERMEEAKEKRKAMAVPRLFFLPLIPIIIIISIPLSGVGGLSRRDVNATLPRGPPQPPRTNVFGRGCQDEIVLPIHSRERPSPNFEYKSYSPFPEGEQCSSVQGRPQLTNNNRPLKHCVIAISCYVVLHTLSWPPQHKAKAAA